MAGLSPTPKQQIFGSDGAPLVGGKIYTYLAGTSTPATTYTDFGAGTANTNPIILDSFGQANIWLLSSTSYKFIVRTATEVLLYTVDNISTPLDVSSLASPPPIGNTTPNTGAFTTLTASGAVTLTGLGAMKLNAGTTAERPTPSNGMIRYNTTTASMEGYVNSAWTGLVTSVATGTGLTGGPITTTGTISIDSTVVTLTGTQTLTNKTLTTPNINSAQFATVSGTAPIYPCRAWVNFDGTGTVAIRASGNVSSITDNATGDYTVNFTTAMSDANYSILLTSGYTTNGASPSFGVSNRIGINGNESAPTTSSFRFNITDTAGSVVDTKYVNVSIFR
jgi:hypothetical protein